MKKSFQIFKRDLGRLFRNRAAVLILVGISVLPSLYAWFNIAANMDPYGNTKGIQVAIANEDKGADSEQMSLDAGQNIVDNLKKNDQLGWKFVDAKEAKKGVRSGKYYAAIVIPDNFSFSSSFTKISFLVSLSFISSQVMPICSNNSKVFFASLPFPRAKVKYLISSIVSVSLHKCHIHKVILLCIGAIIFFGL
mgnify:CR=1 FL=1